MSSFTRLEPEFVVRIVSALHASIEVPASYSKMMENLFPFVTASLAESLGLLCLPPGVPCDPATLLDTLSGNISVVDDLGTVMKTLDPAQLEQRVTDGNELKELEVVYRQSADGTPICRCFLPSLGLGLRFQWTTGLPPLEAAQIKRRAGIRTLEHPGMMWRLKCVSPGNDLPGLKTVDMEWETASAASVRGFSSDKKNSKCPS